VVGADEAASFARGAGFGDQVLFDTRSSCFVSPAAHGAMREVFNGPPAEFARHPVRAALLNPHTDGRVGPNEAFFTEEADAIAWLQAL
jgi:hypothetical protein